MLEGKIIKFFRIKANLTQSELGQGICSKSHVSKIETGQTDYANEITMLLAKRLQFNMAEEIERYKKISDLLHQWNNEMISMRQSEILRIKEQLESETLIELQDFRYHYLLLKARFFIAINDITHAKKTLQHIQKNTTSLSNYEKNLLKHITGIIALNENDYTKAVQELRKINERYYNNPEHFYNLAVSYRQLNEHSKAYYYAQKALKYFTETNRFLRIIDGETLLLSLEGTISEANFKDTVQKYYSLIQNCELCNDLDGKLIVMYNLAYEYFKHKHFGDAVKLFAQLMEEGEINIQLLSRHFFILCCYELQTLTNQQLLILVDEGALKANELELTVIEHLFKLLHYFILKQRKRYYLYLKKHALPDFKEHGFVNEFVHQLERKLLIYLVKQNEHEMALEVSLNMLNIDIDNG